MSKARSDWMAPGIPLDECRNPEDLEQKIQGEYLMIEIDEPMISWVMLAARGCLAAVFLASGIHKLLYYSSAQAECRTGGVPLIGLLLPLTICLHLVAPIGLIIGIAVTEFSLALALFTFVATLKVHCFWRMQGAQRLDQSRIALAHLAIIGGLLMLAVAGPGTLVI